MYFTEERDRELYIAFRRMFETSEVKIAKRPFQRAIELAVRCPCSRYYLSTQDVYRYIRCKKKGREWFRERKTKGREKTQEAYKQIYEIYLRLRDKMEFRGCSDYFIASFVTSAPAPSFFITYTHARRIIAKERKRRCKAKAGAALSGVADVAPPSTAVPSTAVSVGLCCRFWG